jgi:hypothetical protein
MEVCTSNDWKNPLGMFPPLGKNAVREFRQPRSAMVMKKLIGVALVLPWAALGATVFTHEVRSTVKKQPEIVFLVRLPEGVRDIPPARRLFQERELEPG